MLQVKGITPTQRIILNTLVTYGRNVFSIILGLFSGRWVLQALGNIDYGLMGVVGGLIVFATFLSGITSGACTRFFALSIGSGDVKETQEWFKIAQTIHIILPIVLILIFYPIGEWAIRCILNIPTNRLTTALWVFRISVFNAFISMLAVPYLGMWTAKQLIAEISFWSIIQTFLSFLFSYYLLFYKGDTWLLWAIFSTLLNCIYSIWLMCRGVYLFPECQCKVSFICNKKRLMKVLNFVIWQLWGGLTGIFRGSLLAILLNKYFPPEKNPEVNSSFSIGNLLSYHSQSLSLALLGAFSPEITSTEGKGDRKKMFMLANQASKYGVILALLIVIPLSLEINTVLKLWLNNPPKYAAPFCIFFLYQTVADKLTYGQMIAVNAVGKIALYQCLVGGILLSALPLAWLCFTLKCSVISTGWILLGTMITASIVRAFLAKRLIGFPLKNWFLKVIIPVLVLAIISLGSGTIFIQFYRNYNTFARVCATSALTLAVSILTVWILLLDNKEKQFIKDQVLKLKNEIF